MIKVEDLFFSYDNKKNILKDINISIKKGEIISFLGPNGSGKTTLLKCIDTILKPKCGSIYFNGKDIFRMRRYEIARYISYVPQEHKTSFPYTVFDFVLLGRSPYIGLFSTPKKEDIEKCYEALNFLGIVHLSERIYTQISGGEKKLCLIARALVCAPEVLLLDEPTAHLDIKHQIDVIKNVREISKQNGLSVIMTLHDPNLALLTSDRIVLLKNGEVIGVGSGENILTKENIERTYDCEVEFVSDSNTKFIYPRFN